MAHYAFLDENNVVTEVITGRHETEVVNGISDWEAYYGAIRGQVCKRTSYNNNIRKRFAGIGSTYSEDLDMFIDPKPYPSWTLDENGDWQAPVPKPDLDGLWQWLEDEQEWTR
jgi:hypothetical protein